MADRVWIQLTASRACWHNLLCWGSRPTVGGRRASSAGGGTEVLLKTADICVPEPDLTTAAKGSRSWMLGLF